MRTAFCGRLFAAICVLLVLAPTFLATGLVGPTSASFEAPVTDYAAGELSVDEPAHLTAILAWRQVASVEAKRIVPEGPPPQSVAVRGISSLAPTFAVRGTTPWPVLAAHTRLLPSNRTPTGPPTA